MGIQFLGSALFAVSDLSIVKVFFLTKVPILLSISHPRGSLTDFSGKKDLSKALPSNKIFRQLDNIVLFAAA